MLVVFHACMGTFTGAAIIPAFETIAEDLDVSVPTTTYLTSLQIMIFGVAPFFWLPLSQRFGRRPIFLVSLVCSLAGNIGCAKSMSYSSMAGSRAVGGLYCSSWRHWQWRGTRDLFQTWTCTLYGNMDPHGDDWHTAFAIHLWLCCSQDLVSLDILDTSYSKYKKPYVSSRI